MRKNNIELMETGPVGRTIITLALPMMLGTIASMVYNMTDTFFIGKTGDPNMVAGISVTMPLFMVSQGIASIFAIGAASYISRCLGAKNGDEARHTASVSFFATVAAGLLMTVLLMIFRSRVLRVIGTSDITYPYALSYFSIISSFIVFGVTNFSLSGMARSEGATDKAMKGTLIGIVLNIILDPIFILALNWGVAGAAWATIIGQVSSVAYLMGHFMSKHTVLSIKPSDFRPNARMYGEILKIGVPASLSHMIMTLSAILTNRIAVSYGDFVVAGGGVSMRVTSIAFMLTMALAQGYQPFAGYNYGAKNFTRLKRGLKLTMLFTSCLTVFFAVTFYLFGPGLIAFFINEPKTVAAGGMLIRAFVLGLPVMGIQMTMMTTFQALGKPVLATIVTMGRQFLFYLPLLFTLNHFFGFEGYIYSQPVADICTSLVSIALSGFIFREMRGKP